jgi:putative flippase GtrA
MATSNNTKALSESVRAKYMHPFGMLNQAIVRTSLRFGTKAKEVERFLKFAVVGALGAIIDFGALNLLQATVLRPHGSQVELKVVLATGLAFSTAVSSNFIWNHYWTYPDSRTRPLHQQLAQFFFVNTMGLFFRLWFVKTLFGPFGDIGVSALQALGVIGDSISEASIGQLGTNIAQFWAVWIVMLWNFFVNRHWTYNDVE